MDRVTPEPDHQPLCFFPSPALPVDKELMKAKQEKESGTRELWMPMGAAQESLLLGKGGLCSELWLGLPSGEPRGFSPLAASLAEWQKHGEAAGRSYSCPDCGRPLGFAVGLQDPPQSHSSLGSPGSCLSSPSGSEGRLLHPPGCPPEAGEGPPPPPPTGEKTWACPWCQQRFRLRVNLLVHESSHLEAAAELGGKDRLACRFCPRRFGRSDHLLRHQMSHTGARPYQCSACEKSFTDKSKLTNHYRIHTGERPFRCSVCGKHFIRRHHLIKHLRTHTRERPHQCPACPKSFMQKHHLQKHLRTHTGEKPYQCSRCPKAFSCRQRLLQHCCSVVSSSSSSSSSGPVGEAESGTSSGGVAF